MSKLCTIIDNIFSPHFIASLVSKDFGDLPLSSSISVRRNMLSGNIVEPFFLNKSKTEKPMIFYDNCFKVII